MQYFLKSISLALQNIKSNPLHTFLSTLGIIIGVASLVGILALGDGLEDAARKRLSTTTSVQSFSVFSKSNKMVNDISVRVEDRPKITYNQARELDEKYAGRAAVEYVQNSSGQAVYRDSLIGIYLYGSMENGRELIPGLEVVAGRFLQRDDIDQQRNIVVLNKIMAHAWAEDPSELVGQQITISEEEFEVVGIVNIEMKGPRAVIPITVLDNENEFYPTITMKVSQVEEIPLIKEEIALWLDENFEEGREAFHMISDDFWVEQLSQGILLFKLIMGAITGISVLVGGIGVMNVLLISVTERTREIGIRKATGAKKKDILLQFMAESVTISMAGSVVGWIAGMVGLMAFIPIVNKVTDVEFNLVINSSSVFIILLVAVLIGVAFGTYPAWRAAQLNPIDAIRHE